MDETTRDWVKLVGGVILAVGMVLIFARKDGDWAKFPLLVVLAIPTAVLLGLGTAGVKGGDDLPGWRSTYLVTGILLLLLTLLQLAVVLGADAPLSAPGTRVWVFSLTAAAAAYLALELDSRVNILLAALAAAVVGLALVDWIGDPGYKTLRWVLLVEAAIFLALAMSMRDERPDHSNYLVDAAGVTAVLAGSIGYIATGLGNAIGAAFVGATSTGGGQGNFWELFLLVVSLALIAYTGWRSYRGTAYIGLVGLLLFAVIVGDSNALGGWPIILTIVGAAAVAVSAAGGGLATPGGRPTRTRVRPTATTEAPPPPPPPPGAPEAPPPPPGGPAP